MGLTVEHVEVANPDNLFGGRQGDQRFLGVNRGQYLRRVV